MKISKNEEGLIEMIEDSQKKYKKLEDDYKYIADKYQKLGRKYVKVSLYNFFISACFAVYVIASTIGIIIILNNSK